MYGIHLKKPMNYLNVFIYIWGILAYCLEKELDNFISIRNKSLQYC